MGMVKTISKLVLLTVISSMIFGCATAPVTNNRFFWPSLPDEPKIEWLGAYRTQRDMPKTSGQRLFESVVGEEEVYKFNRPMGIASDGAGKVYITDPLDLRILVFDFNINKVHVFGEKDLPSIMKEPMGIAIDRTGKIYVTDPPSKKVFVFDQNEKLINRINLTGDTKRPIGIAIDDERNRLIVADPVVHNLEVYGLDGKHLKTIGKIGTEPGELFGPTWVTTLRNGNIVVSEFRNCRLQVLDPEGKSIRVIGQRGDNPGELQMPKGIAADSEGHIYSVDGKANTVNIFSEAGEYLLTFGGSFAAESKIAPGGFLLPQGIAIDKNDTIFVVDQFNFRFQKLQYMNEKYVKEHPVDIPTPAAVVK